MPAGVLALKRVETSETQMVLHCGDCFPGLSAKKAVCFSLMEPDAFDVFINVHKN